ncbi:MAG: hypothetical protein HYZ53_05840 [Planctomycetes bacterium]|nr:hypothetical protein [Planctomycetota bacterium]
MPELQPDHLHRLTISHLGVRVEAGTQPIRGASWYDPELGFFGFESDRHARAATSVMGQYVVYDLDDRGEILRLEVLCPESLCQRKTHVLPERAEEGRCRLTLPEEFPELPREVEFAWDPASAILHVRFEGPASVRTVRAATSLLLDVDGEGRLTGFWLEGVGPVTEGETG